MIMNNEIGFSFKVENIRKKWSSLYMDKVYENSESIWRSYIQGVTNKKRDWCKKYDLF